MPQFMTVQLIFGVWGLWLANSVSEWRGLAGWVGDVHDGRLDKMRGSSAAAASSYDSHAPPSIVIATHKHVLCLQC